MIATTTPCESGVDAAGVDAGLVGAARPENAINHGGVTTSQHPQNLGRSGHGVDPVAPGHVRRDQVSQACIERVIDPRYEQQVFDGFGISSFPRLWWIAGTVIDRIENLFIGAAPAGPRSPEGRQTET